MTLRVWSLNRFFRPEPASLLATPPTQIVMLAAASPKPHGVDVVVGPLDSESWEFEALRDPTPNAMKLLDLKNVRSLMLRNLDVCRKGPPTLNDDQRLPRVPETDSDLHCGTAEVANSSDVNKLLALDIEELVRHTYRVQRERRTAGYVRPLLNVAVVVVDLAFTA